MGKWLQTGTPTKLLGQVGWEAGRAATHGLLQGGLALAQGGDFGSGFAAGAFSSFGGSLTQNIKAPVAVHVAFGALLGGAASEIGGGSFIQGAVIGGFVSLLNHNGNHGTKENKYYDENGNLKWGEVLDLILNGDENNYSVAVIDPILMPGGQMIGGVKSVKYLKIKDLQKLVKSYSKEMNTFFKSGGMEVASKEALVAYRELGKRMINGTKGIYQRVTNEAKNLHRTRIKMIDEALEKLFK